MDKWYDWFEKPTPNSGSEIHGTEDLVWYGYDPDAPFPSDISTSDVDVVDVENPLNRIAFERPFGIDPLGNSESFGVTIFLEALRVISEPI